MATLRFEIDTDASYDAEELEELQNEFIDWVTKVDGDAVAETADVGFVRESSSDVDVKSEVLELMKSGVLMVSVSLGDADGEEVFSTGEVPVPFA